MDESALPAGAQCWILHWCKGVHIAHVCSRPSNESLCVLASVSVRERETERCMTMV